MQNNLKLWREAAGIILVAKTATSSNSYNYKLLTVQRSNTMKFMPNLYSFPGGVLEKLDGLKDWLKLYETFGLGKNYFDYVPKNKLPVFNNFTENEMPRYISLRISAIRETFEECGLLFCKDGKTTYKTENFKGTSSPFWVNYYDKGSDNLKEWQKRVQKDPNEFLKMCYELEIYPDIHGLHLWCNWLTPYAEMARQYDTVFFLAALQSLPEHFNSDPGEIQDAKWMDPEMYLKKNKESEIMFAPPQYYEISRIYNFNNITELLEYGQKQSIQGCDRILPYRIMVAGTNVTILPGDDLYPGKEELEKRTVTELEEFPISKIKHRLIHKDLLANEIVIANYFPSLVLPFTQQKNHL